jgi:uncharacterized glyoxalase superfamily protein PhnB
MPLEITGLSPMLKVSNLAQTIKFYTQTLGFTVQNQMNDDSGKPSWCALKWGAASLMFYSAESLDQPPGPSAMTGVVYFNPADVRALWEHLRDRAEVAWPVLEMLYGMLEFSIFDCNGYILSFGQEV